VVHHEEIAMTERARILRFDTRVTRVLTALGLIGACTVVDKGDYTFTDDPEEAGGESGSSSGGSSGSSSGTGGRGGTSGDAGEGSGGTGNGGTSGSSGTSGASGEAGGGMGGDGGGVCDPPCENDGTCVTTGTTPRCECAPGYEGDSCGDEIDECDPNPCAANITCVDLVADFRCECPQQLTGKTCHLPRFQGIPGPTGFLNQSTLARAVSADGTVVLGEVSGVFGGATTARPFRWTVESGSEVVPLPSVIRADVSVRPWSISGDGGFWVGEFRSTSAASSFPMPIGGPTEPVDVNTPLPMFMLPPGGTAGFAFDTDDDGSMSVGNFYDPAATGTQAVRYSETGMSVALPNPFGQSSPLASANAVTRDGTILAGTVKDTMGNVYVNFWGAAGSDAPGMVRTLAGITDVEVHGVSGDAAMTAGTYWDATFSNFAFYSTGSRFVPLFPMNGMTPPRSNAWDVSDDGAFIVGDIQLAPGMMALDDDVLEQTTVTQHAVIWKPDGMPPRTVLDVLRESGVTPAGWQLRTAYGVSADGKVIVGAGIDPMGLPQGFIARLP
jgi:hypothetical protein